MTNALTAILTASVFLLLMFSPAQADTDVEDITAPVIVSVAVEPTVINTSSGAATLTMTVHVTDDLSGVERGYYRFEPANPLVSGQLVDVYTDKSGTECTGTPNNLTCVIPFTLPQYSAGGEWVPTWIFTRDAIGNSRSLPESERTPGMPAYISFTNNTEGTSYSEHIYLPTLTNANGEFPFLLGENSGQCVHNAGNTFFSGFVRDTSNNLVNGVCVHIAFYEPRNTKCSGCDGVGDGIWGFSPFGGPAKGGEPIEIFVVLCEGAMPPGGQTSQTGFGNLTPQSPKWTHILNGSEQCTGITFYKK